LMKKYSNVKPVCINMVLLVVVRYVEIIGKKQDFSWRHNWYYGIWI